MEREVMLTGIGGQGVQLAAQVIARAATAEGRNVSYFGMYGGEMRGGNTESTVVVADGRIDAPPILAKTWSAVVLHHEFWASTRSKLRPGSLVVVNSTLFEGDLDREVCHVVDVPATELAATKLGNVMTQSMVMTGAYVQLTGLVDLESAIAAMRDALPAYRKQHAELNERALRLGAELVDALAFPAWREEVAAR
jgi:2-oxoacid:acceptor oxidoreductase gamma subunit (pyruvate/2-ketoisovalerate family)